jgi:hypothetical protein
LQISKLTNQQIVKSTNYKKKVASDLHRTATTEYLCCVPTLEDFSGAGRVGLAGAKVQLFYYTASFFEKNLYLCG